MSENREEKSVMPEGTLPSLQVDLKKNEIDYLQNVSMIKLPTQSSAAEILSPLTKTKNEKIYQEILQELRKDFYERMSKGSTLAPIAEKQNFQALKTLGFGSFGIVFLTLDKNSGTHYAMKCLKKERIVKKKQIEHTLYEKILLESLRYPFIIYMDYFFMDNSYLYFVMRFINGGDLFTHLKKMGKFTEEVSKFYASQVFLALDFLQFCDILYRDLKPENILIDVNGYLKLADLGFCKIVKGRTWTLCGTPEYIAPEVILSKGYGKTVDWWSFGVLLFEMNAGFSPFVSSDHMKIYKKIVRCHYLFPPRFSHELKDLIGHLLQLDLTRRYGCLRNGTRDIKFHKWFENLDFLAIYNQEVEPRFKPVITSDDDTSHFQDYRKESLKISDHNEYEAKFQNF